jgi:D-lactate dehydrogenase
MKMAFFDTHAFEKSFWESKNSGQHEINFLNVRLSAQSAKLAENTEAVVIFVHDKADADAIDTLSKLGVRYLLLRSAGYNHVDLKACQKAGIKVARVPEYSPFAVAEHTIALILALNRKIPRAYNRVRDLNFSLDGLVGFDLHGKTAGVIGTGRIGAQVARLLAAFGCQVLAVDPVKNSDLDDSVTYVDRQALLSQSDILTVHAPLNESTRHLINEKTIAQMKSGIMLINTSRGAILDTKEIIKALKTAKIGYLGLDVYEEEDALFFEDHSGEIIQDDLISRLLTFPNVLITSHQAFLTKEALQKIAATCLDNLDSMVSNKPCPNQL